MPQVIAAFLGDFDSTISQAKHIVEVLNADVEKRQEASAAEDSSTDRINVFQNPSRDDLQLQDWANELTQKPKREES